MRLAACSRSRSPCDARWRERWCRRRARSRHGPSRTSDRRAAVCSHSAGSSARPSAVLLHVAVARAADAGGVQRDLHQAGAIDAEAALAAPEIGRADEAFGDRDEIGFAMASIAARCGCGRYQPSRVTAKAPSSRATVELRSHHQRLDRRQLDRGAGKGERPDRGDLVRRRGAPASPARIGQPADIAVAARAGPRPSLRRCGRRS